ncbi:ADP-ribosylation/crystallin J1 [Flavobacterium sp. HNIBRBA15423]|uniref:ADP-ribosylation/crystallin J1 n=1 Tax=Flavobacterium sp. HNIBRBA15423 TaxID=3458683 RepID=UPI004044F4AE
MKTTKLYRPVGLKEMELITESDFKSFPPRLDWQTIFYPVMNQEYAEQIAKEWNTPDEFSGYCGIVTAFDVNSDYLQQFEIQNVGDKNHNELWIPSEELEVFNKNIVGEIKIVKVFYGEKYQNSQNETLKERLKEIDSL